MRNHIAVIGSGFGGLSAAIRLQAQGFRVTLFEKNERVGGHAYQLVKQGYTFDMGPSLITAPDVLQKVFAVAGRRMEDYLDLHYLDPFYRIYFHDRTYIDYTGDADRMKAQIAQFNSHDAANYDHFMRDAKKLYDAVMTDGLGTTPFMDLQTYLGFVPRALQLNALYPAYTFVKRYFQDFRTRFTFSFHPLFIGASPFRAPALYLMIPYLEKCGGVWFSTGGMYALVQAFERVFLELGGVVRTSSPVEEIIVTHGRATAVRSCGEVIAVDAVVSNADFVHTQTALIKPEHRKKWTDTRVQKLKYSMGAFLMYMGVKKQYPELLHHTLILTERYKELVKDIFDRKILPKDFSMYLHVPTRTDSSMAPAGCESMYVLIPVANLASGLQWETIKHEYAQRVLKFLEEDFGMTHLRANLEVLELFTPEDFRRERNSYLGSAWGVEPSLLQTGYFRPHNRSEDIPNLYIVGTSTHPGAGVPGVLMTAETTHKLICKDFGLSFCAEPVSEPVLH
ncbi:MAG: phytoene desaturase family protein [Bacteroidota bacterium]|nr:phytoene desaturase family protein [Candidatus Kapabacteria bacterium]MDW8220268.1 phytoene desaturase family protein [Bacteroidota bacterium]